MEIAKPALIEEESQQTPNVPSFVNGSAAGRDAAGRFAPGNQVARQTGMFARQQPAELVEALDAFTAAIVADLGGPAELTELERGYVGRLRSLELRARLLDADLEEHGLLTPSGGVRRAHREFLDTVRTWDQMAQRLGTRRRAKRVDLARALSGLDR